MRIGRRFVFDAAHHLPRYEGKCRNQHGHRWYLDVVIQGGMNRNTGFVEDFSVLKKIVNETVVDILDHQDLNELSLPFSDNPTCERILEWIWGVLEETFKSSHYWIQKLTLYEAPESWAELP